MYDKITITADFILKAPTPNGQQRLSVEIKRVEHPSPEYGDGSAHMLTVDGNADYLDTRYDMIPSDPMAWEGFWEVYLAKRFDSAEIIKTYMLWKRGK